jgi:hypothetical protein
MIKTIVDGVFASHECYKLPGPMLRAQVPKFAVYDYSAFSQGCDRCSMPVGQPGSGSARQGLGGSIYIWNVWADSGTAASI